MDWYYVVVPLLLLWPAIQVFKVYLVAKIMLGLRYGGTKVESVPVNAIPAYLRQAAAGELQRLSQLGFRLKQALRVTDSNGPAFERFILDLAHATEPIRALIQAHDAATRSGEFWIEFVTLRVDGLDLRTSAHAETQLSGVGSEDDHEVQFGADAAVLLNRHRERIAAAEKAGAWLLVTNNRAMILAAQWRADSRTEALRASGQLKLQPDGSLTWKIRTAFAAAAKALWAERKRVKTAGAALQRVSTQLVPPEAQNECDWRHYRQMIAFQRGKLPGRAKTILTMISLVLFCAYLAWQMSWASAIALLVALTIHEFGHLAGMWMFGHRDTQLLFLPFFGGAAVSHDPPILAPWKELVILFLGPLPGLFLGIFALCVLHQPPAWVKDAAWIFVALNAFNLLPAIPLDGGRILDAALANRFPRLRVGFVAVSGAVLVLLGLTLFTGILAVIGVGMLLRLGYEWRAARSVVEIRAEGSEGCDEESVVRRLLRRMREPDWGRTPMVQRLNAVPHLQMLLRQPLPGIGTLVLAVLLFFSPLVLFTGLAAVKGVQLWSGGGSASTRPLDPNAPQFSYTPPRPTPAQLASPENAATQFDAALTAWWKETQRSAEVSDPGLAAASKKNTIALLREAAQGKFFAIDPQAKFVAEHRWMQSPAVQMLVAQAQEDFRAGETAKAQALIVDTVRLLRLLRTVPARWTASHDADVIATLTELLEEASARGEGWDRTTRAWLAALFDDAAHLKFVRVAHPIEQLTDLEIAGAFTDQMMDQSKSGAGKLLWKMVGAAAEANSDDLADAHANAVAIQKGIDDTVAGRWLVRPADSANETEAGQRELTVWYELKKFTSSLARVRQARAAIAVLEARAALGRMPQGFAEIQVAGWTGAPVNPRHGAALRWSERDGRAVLDYPDPKPAEAPTNSAGVPPAAAEAGANDDGEEDGDEGVVTPWRLPKT